MYHIYVTMDEGRLTKRIFFNISFIKIRKEKNLIMLQNKGYLQYTHSEHRIKQCKCSLYVTYSLHMLKDTYQSFRIDIFVHLFIVLFLKQYLCYFLYNFIILKQFKIIIYCIINFSVTCWKIFFYNTLKHIQCKFHSIFLCDRTTRMFSHAFTHFTHQYPTLH